MTPFTLHVLQLIKSIPSGRVMTYGQIARLAGSPRGARQVVRILHSMSQKYQLPWHRVINVRGEIALPDEEGVEVQRLSLEAEGIQFTLGHRIDLEQYQHHPDRPPLEELGAVLDWVVEVMGDDAVVLSAKPLLGGVTSTMHELELLVGEKLRQVVLRQFTSQEWLAEQPDLAEHEAESLTWAAVVDVPSPQLLGYRETDVPCVLMTKLPGAVDLHPDVQQLARALVRIHERTAEPFEREYFSYQNAAAFDVPSWSERPDLWRAALQAVRGPRPESRICFLHRDFHPANVLWQDGAVSGVVDWVNACRGPAGVDVGHCRLNLAMLHGVELADAFLDAYVAEAGAAFRYEPYWDLVSLMDWLPGKPSVYAGWTDLGMTGLTDELMLERYEAYLESLLNRFATFAS